MSTSNESFLKKAYYWLLYKVYYGATLKGMITFTIVYEFVVVLFLSTFSEPVTAIFGAPLIPISLPEETKNARLIMLYHSLALPFLAACSYFILEFWDIKENLLTRTKWLIFFGSMLSSLSAITFAYLLFGNWLIHALYLLGLSITFAGGVSLLIAVVPMPGWPEKKEEGPYIKGINIAQWALTVLVICVLLSVILGASIGAYFGNGIDEAILAEDHLRTPYDLFVNAIKAHLHVMLALIDGIILFAVYRYTVPDQKGKWYTISMLMAIPGIIILSMGSWLVTLGKENLPFDPHYLVYAGASFLLSVALILALTGWNKTAKEILGDDYEKASWFTRAKAVFKDPIKLGLYFQFIWVNFVMTFPGIFLAFSLEEDSIISSMTDIVPFREGPLFVEVTVARGHWHVLAVLSAIIVLSMFVDLLDIQGIWRKLMGWLFFAGSVIAFAFAVIYMYGPHLDPNVVNFADDAAAAYAAQAIFVGISFLFIDLGITLFSLAIVIFCFHQFFEIVQGKKDVHEWPEK